CARRGPGAGALSRVGLREAVPGEFIRDEVARGRLVIPANVRHLAGSGGEMPAAVDGEARREYPDAAIGHPGARPDAGLWVNQTVTQHQAVLDDPALLRGERAPKRLDPTG